MEITGERVAEVFLFRECDVPRYDGIKYPRELDILCMLVTKRE